MRALTGYPLWFGLIAAGLKPDKNRGRSLIRREDFGIPFALHQGAKQKPKEHDKTWRWIERIAPDLVEGWSHDDDPVTWPPWYRLAGVAGAVTAVATIERCAEIHDGWLHDAYTHERICEASKRRFAFGPIIYMLRDVRALATPVPCPGKLGFWTLSDDVARAVAAQIVRAP